MSFALEGFCPQNVSNRQAITLLIYDLLQLPARVALTGDIEPLKDGKVILTPLLMMMEYASSNVPVLIWFYFAVQIIELINSAVMVFICTHLMFIFILFLALVVDV